MNTLRLRRFVGIALVVLVATLLMVESITAPREIASHPVSAASERRDGRRPDEPSTKRRVIRPQSEVGAPHTDVRSSEEDAGPPLDRWATYAAMLETLDPSELESLIAILVAALGDELCSTLEADFRTVAENSDDRLVVLIGELIAGAPHCLAGTHAGAMSPIEWLAYFSLSQHTARVVQAILMHLEVAGPDCLEALLDQWRGGLPDSTTERLAVRVFEWIALRLTDLTPIIDLLDDPDPRLQTVAERVLVRMDPGRWRAYFETKADGFEPTDRVRRLVTILGALPEGLRVDALIGWQQRWPDDSWSPGWSVIGSRDGNDLIRAYNALEDPRHRQQVLVGWFPDSTDPETAESFLTEVYDTAEESFVRGQALIALGQIDHSRARQRLEEAWGEATFDDVAYLAQLKSGIRNAMSTAPREWIERFALSVARSVIAEAGDARRPGERGRWRRAIAGRYPDLAREFDE